MHGRMISIAIGLSLAIVSGCSKSSAPAKTIPVGEKPTLAIAPTTTTVTQGGPAAVDYAVNTNAFTRILDADANNESKGRQPYVEVEAEILLKNVPDQPFRLEGVLTDASGVPIKVGGEEFFGSRVVKTGDDEDEEEYSFMIPCQRLYTLKPVPTQVFVRLRLVDPAGKISSEHPLVPFKPSSTWVAQPK